MDDFYVYEHWRLDTGECFYVGKGKGKRSASKTGRNRLWRRVTSKLDRIGANWSVIIVGACLTEDAAFALERARISFWREKGDKLVNMTDGGEGVANPPAHVRAAISEANKRRICTPENLAKRRASMLGKTSPNKGRTMPQEQRDKIRSKLLGRVFSAEERRKISDAKKGYKHSDSTREKMRIAWAKRRRSAQEALA